MTQRRQPKRVSKEFEAMKKEIAELRAAHEAKASEADGAGADHLANLKAEIEQALTLIRKKIESVGVGGDVGEDLNADFHELREVVADYFAVAEKTVAAHPLAALAGAVAVGFALGRLTR
jgi:ElaB/YqjD/DUF883 family membrane-anchored ribosome-binding protein